MLLLKLFYFKFLSGDTIRLDGKLLTRQISREQDIFDPDSAEINKYVKWHCNICLSVNI